MPTSIVACDRLTFSNTLKPMSREISPRSYSKKHRDDVLYPDDMEPEDMKLRRLAALEEYALRNPEYKDLVTTQLKLERGDQTSERAPPVERPDNGESTSQPKRSARTVGTATTTPKGKKLWWNVHDSIQLLAAITRFRKSGTRAIGQEKWRIIAGSPELKQHLARREMSFTEFGKYCRVRYSNMLHRRTSNGTSYKLPDELNKKVEEYYQVFYKAHDRRHKKMSKNNTSNIFAAVLGKEKRK